jgi:putative transposase
LTIADNLTRESMAITVDQGERVVEDLDRILTGRNAPKSIWVDKSPELVSKALDRWAYGHKATLGFSRPGKATTTVMRNY